jgi:hypothetical protein
MLVKIRLSLKKFIILEKIFKSFILKTKAVLLQKIPGIILCQTSIA